MGDNNALLIKGSVFVKFQKSCIIEKTQQGSIYMNSLQKFRKLYSYIKIVEMKQLEILMRENCIYIMLIVLYLIKDIMNIYLIMLYRQKMKMILFIVFLTLILISTIFFNLEMK